MNADVLIYAGSSKVDEEQLRIAQEKFDESKHLCETAMYNVLDNDVSVALGARAFAY
jgi:hypothetical protein